MVLGDSQGGFTVSEVACLKKIYSNVKTDSMIALQYALTFVTVLYSITIYSNNM